MRLNQINILKFVLDEQTNHLIKTCTVLYWSFWYKLCCTLRYFSFVTFSSLFCQIKWKINSFLAIIGDKIDHLFYVLSTSTHQVISFCLFMNFKLFIYSNLSSQTFVQVFFIAMGMQVAQIQMSNLALPQIQWVLLGLNLSLSQMLSDHHHALLWIYF